MHQIHVYMEREKTKQNTQLSTGQVRLKMHLALNKGSQHNSKGNRDLE